MSRRRQFIITTALLLSLIMGPGAFASPDGSAKELPDDPSWYKGVIYVVMPDSDSAEVNKAQATVCFVADTIELDGPARKWTLAPAKCVQTVSRFFQRENRFKHYATLPGVFGRAGRYGRVRIRFDGPGGAPSVSYDGEDYTLRIIPGVRVLGTKGKQKQVFKPVPVPPALPPAHMR